MPYTQLIFHRTKKPRNNTGIVTAHAKPYPQCLIKDESGIVHPTVRINFKSAQGMLEFTSSRYNYCYWPEVKRYYYISEITFVSATVVDIDLEVDVLSSFQEDIHNTNAFVQYAESAYNSMIPDTRLSVSHKSNQTGVQVDSGLSISETGCFVVSIASVNAAGGTGPITAYAMDVNEIVALSNRLYDQTLWDRVIDTLYSPDDAIVGCIWLPLNKSEVAFGGNSSIKFGGYELGTGAEIKKRIDKSVVIEPYVPYVSEHKMPDGSTVENYADYRNCEPYTEYTLWVPGVGLVEIPMTSLIGDGTEKPTFKVEFSIATTTGDITHRIKRVNNSTASGVSGDEILFIKGNFGVNIPVAKSQSGFGGAIASFLSSAGGLIVGGVMAGMGNPLGLGIMASSGMSAFSGEMKMMQISRSAVGAIGGWSIPVYMHRYFYAITKVNEVSDYPSRIESVIGRPLFQMKRLGDLEGLVRCTGAFVAPDGATDEEQRLIAQYVNSSANFIFGGLIICNGAYGE